MGLIGIANKKGGFTEQDATIASALGEIAAIALRNSRFVDLLKTSEDRFRALTENTTDITAIISPEGIIRYCSPSLEKLHGIAPEKIIGIPLLSFFHPDDQDSYNNVLTTLASGSVESMRIEDIRIRFSQKTWTHFDVLFTSMIDHPSVKGIVITCRDITEHLAMEERLRQAHKMEAIRTLCGGIAHDFNNNLSAMIGYAELGLYEVGTITVAGHYFKQILNGCERARKLIQQISAFSGINVFELKPVAVSQLLEEAVQQCRPSLPPHVSLTVENRCSDTSIKGSSAQISQMIFHLLSNALLSLPDEGGTITVVLDAVTLHETTRMLDFEIPPGDYLRLSVSDTGCGIDPSILNRIFDPFFTTRDIGQGSGMGLAVVHGVVLRHGGGIAVESEPGKGTSFHILLPKVLVSQLKIAHGAKQ